MTWNRFVRRAVVIAVVLFAVSVVTVAASQRAYHEAIVNDNSGCGNVEHPWDPAMLHVVNDGLNVLVLQVLPVVYTFEHLPAGVVPDMVGGAAILGLGSLVWAFILATGWAITERLLDWYRRRAPDGTLGP